MAENNTSIIESMLDKLNIGLPGSLTYQASTIIISIAVILLVGFLFTRLTKLIKLPNVIAYIIAGIIIGPYALNIIPMKIVSGMEFISDIALAFIAFSAGEFFKISSLKKVGPKVIVITLFESILTFGVVFFVTAVILKIDISFALVLGALSSATAPASTLMTIRQTKASGEYVNTLLEVVALDDVITLLLYSLSIFVCVNLKSDSGTISFKTIIWPIARTIIVLAIGFGFGFLLRLLISRKRTTDNRLIIVIAILFSFSGIAMLFNESPLLGCMAIGMVYTNTQEKDDKLFKQLNYFAPPIMLLFFVRSGMNFDLRVFAGGGTIDGRPFFLVAVIYFLFRIITKYLGSFLGALITKSPKNIRNYLGFALIPQAGVAIGLASLGARTFYNYGQTELGDALITIILATSVLYEIFGPASAKLGLYLSGSFDNKEEIVKEENTVEKLIQEIKNIQANLPKVNIDENEAAFNEVAEEYEYEYRINSRFLNRRKR